MAVEWITSTGLTPYDVAVSEMEARAAGITHFVFVTGRNKQVIEDHFDKNFELEFELEKKGKHDMLEVVRRVVDFFAFHRLGIHRAPFIA